ncbi:ABC transporter permease [Bacillus marasmi]|uniref:ABC transporter permease n=1 Tax=Bacillus marasmi TaxID=1926279 RepID=UPI0011CB7637|nr:ABC transporter permease [Bacillus marasmi]
MDNLIKAELFKLRKDRSLWTLVLGLTVAAIIYPMLMLFGDGSVGSQDISVKDLFVNTALGGNNYIVRLVPCILAGFFISSEFSIGTMKSIGASGNSRSRIYFSKLFAFSIGTIIISLVFPVVMMVISSLLSGFNEMPEIDYLVRTLGFTIIYATAFASIMSLFAIVLTDSGKMIGFSILFFILFDSILYMLSQKLSFVEFLFNHSVFKLFLEIGQMNLENTVLLKMIVVPLTTILAFGYLGSMIFQRKEIK